VVVSCVPGGEIVDIDEDGTIQGALTLSLGPSATRFTGRLTPTFDAADHTGRLEGQGGDGRGRTKAAITTAFTLTEAAPDRTTMAIESSIVVSGALAAFAMTGGQPIAKRLLQDFAENLAALDGESADDGEEAADGGRPAPVAAPLSGFGLVFRALRDVLARFFGRFRRR